MVATIKTLLIANRGEIALRIIRAAREMGLRTVALYSEDDTSALHRKVADTACALRGFGAAAYLDAEYIVALATQEGVDAIHPGYGFLSEHPGFAKSCEQAGVIFVGPSSHQLSMFGDKVKARDLAELTGIPCIGGTNTATSLADANAFYQDLGDDAAIMIKAISGGGGRGMRAVKSHDELAEAYKRCQSEAKAAFGNADVYVERLIQKPRHIEVQIIGDGCGAVSHLWERECSIQRRHQKVVEIAPSPGLNAELKEQLTNAAVRIAQEVSYKGLGTVEFLLDGIDVGKFYFIEVNPRIQVEHTVTEEVLGIDLVKAQIAVAQGKTLGELDLLQDAIGRPKGYAIQMRINMETINPDGSTSPSAGTITQLELPSGPGIRVDTAAYQGYTPSTSFDSLLAKVVVSSPDTQYAQALSRAYQALCEINIKGVQTNTSFLQNLLSHPEFQNNAITTEFIDQHLGCLTANDVVHRQLFIAREPLDRDAGSSVGPAGLNNTLDSHQELGVGQWMIASPLQGVLVELSVIDGQLIQRGEPVAVVEAMKMEHIVVAERSGQVQRQCVRQGEAVRQGQCLLVLDETDDNEACSVENAVVDLNVIRSDLKEVLDRQSLVQDSARTEAIAKRHQQGQRSARANIDHLVDANSFMEYGGLAVAAQRGKRDLDDLIKKTPADGLIAGLAHINGHLFDQAKTRCMVMAYDATVHAGTQGMLAHQKKDRLFELAIEQQLPIVLFAEGGGGRPGDTDITLIVESPSFLKYAQLSGRVPLVGITTRYCFAGNAALLGCSDVIIATRNACIGMAGPAMIEGGGLGTYRPTEVGPIEVQAPNGVIDIVVDDESQAVDVAQQYLAYFQGPVKEWDCADQRLLRHCIPENRSRTYDIRELIRVLADNDSVLELRQAFAPGMITALIRIEGQPFGIIANNNAHLGGAIESVSADKAARFMRLCNAFHLPLVNLMDTPGFMVGPEAEKTAQVRHFSRMFVTAAHCSMPIFTVSLRKGYGLGALAMTAGSFHAPIFSVAWPSGEFGPMGLEGAVRLGHRKELDAIENLQDRQVLFDQLLEHYAEMGSAINMASHLEIDNVIDPMKTRQWLSQGLSVALGSKGTKEQSKAFIDTW